MRTVKRFFLLMVCRHRSRVIIIRREVGSHLLEEEAFSRATCFVHDSINIGVEKTNNRL